MPSCHQSPTNCGSQAMCPYILRMVSSRGCSPLHLRPFRDSPNEVERCPQGPKEAQLFRRMNELHVVTGAFGYSGRYIAARLLAAGHRVRTLTNSPKRPNPFGDQVEALPFNFERPDRRRRHSSVLQSSITRTGYASTMRISATRELSRTHAFCLTRLAPPAFGASSTSASQILLRTRRSNTSVEKRC